MKTSAYVLKLGVTLFLITALVAAALAAVNMVTEPRIAEAKAEKLQNAISQVLPGGGEKLDVPVSGIVTNVYGSDTGYAVEVQPAGFGGTITMMVGVSKDGEVLGISIVSHSETAGLGAVAAAKTTAGEAFRAGFAGLTGTAAVTKDGGTVDAITGATITSRAVCDGVNAAREFVAGLD